MPFNKSHPSEELTVREYPSVNSIVRFPRTAVGSGCPRSVATCVLDVQKMTRRLKDALGSPIEIIRLKVRLNNLHHYQRRRWIKGKHRSTVGSIRLLAGCVCNKTEKTSH